MFGTDKNEERGQVGIGTLIVFIALVLVAAIAAGVLINTAGFLQSQAEATGEESTSQVSDGLQIQTSTAEATASGNIEEIELEVSLAPGSDPVDVTEATLEWVGEDDATTQEIEQIDRGGTDETDSTNVVVDDSDPIELTDSSESTTIAIMAEETDAIGAVGELGTDLPMNAGDSASITITTASGGQTSEVLNVPRIVQDGEGVDL